MNSGATITQPGWEPSPDTPPQIHLHEGPVQFQRRLMSPAIFYQKGYYTLRYDAWMADGSRITEIEATSWVEGRDGDYDGHFPLLRLIMNLSRTQVSSVEVHGPHIKFHMLRDSNDID